MPHGSRHIIIIKHIIVEKYTAKGVRMNGCCTRRTYETSTTTVVLLLRVLLLLLYYSCLFCRCCNYCCVFSPSMLLFAVSVYMCILLYYSSTTVRSTRYQVSYIRSVVVRVCMRINKILLLLEITSSPKLTRGKICAEELSPEAHPRQTCVEELFSTQPTPR